jgi:hypothetical protein
VAGIGPAAADTDPVKVVDIDLAMAVDIDLARAADTDLAAGTGPAALDIGFAGADTALGADTEAEAAVVVGLADMRLDLARKLVRPQRRLAR